MTISQTKFKWKPLNENPGPGEHYISQTLTKKRSPSINMSGTISRRDEFLNTNLTDIPAPSYDVSKEFGTNIKSKMTIGTKAKPEKIIENPGPG